MRRAPALLLLIALALGTAGCGQLGLEPQQDNGTSESGGGDAKSLEIKTSALPEGTREAGYGPEALQADGALGPVTWSLTDGFLPPGMNLTSDGLVTGVPEETGFYTFTVGATDGFESAAKSFGIAIDAFGAVVEGGLFYGDARSGNPISVRGAGQDSTVSFSVVTNASGGHFETVDAGAGTARYVPGPVETEGAVDTIRVTDDSTGLSMDITVTVRPDPTANHIARWGSTDVWYIDMSEKRGSHAFATDMHAILAALGMRQATSTDAQGAELDRLAAELVRIEILRNLNVMYHRNADGSPGDDGLAISFPYREPDASFRKPSAGSWLEGAPGRYSVIATASVDTVGAVGVAYMDSPSNTLHENNSASSASAGDLGIFINRILAHVLLKYNRYEDELVQNPITPDDLPTLKALLYGDAYAPTHRAELIEYMLNGFARSVAAVAAHEVGHSLGLPHTDPSQPGGIMNNTVSIYPTAEYRFMQDEVASLRGGLPGVGRAYQNLTRSDAKPAGVAAAMPAGGVCVCCCSHGDGDDHQHGK